MQLMSLENEEWIRVEKSSNRSDAGHEVTEVKRRSKMIFGAPSAEPNKSARHPHAIHYFIACFADLTINGLHRFRSAGHAVYVFVRRILGL
jgi:hypothetical protein